MDRQLLLRSTLGALPAEIADAIFEEVPELAAQIPVSIAEVLSSPTRDPARNPAIPPKNGAAPFITRLPAEIRREIFARYLLPEKTIPIEPKAHAQRRRDVLKKSAEEAARQTNNRNRVQHQAQVAQQGTAHWNYQLNLTGQSTHLNNFIVAQAPTAAGQNALPPVPQPISGNNPIFNSFAQPVPPVPQTQLNLPAPLPTANTMMGLMGGAIQIVPPPASAAQASLPAPPPTANPMTGWTGGAMQLPSPLAPHAPPLGLGATPQPVNVQNLLQMIPSIPIPGFGGQAIVPLIGTAHAANLYNDDEDAGVQGAIAACFKSDENDPTAENLVLNLLTTNIKLCLEVSTILYEEYTFEVHIHHDGVEFLHFPRVPTLETWGLEIEKTMGAFKTKGHFCFHRMKHINFVIFGGNPDDRLAALRMRESMRILVSFLTREEKPVSEITVDLVYEPKDLAKTIKGWGTRDNCIEDRNGSFWSGVPRGGPNPIYKRYEPRDSILHDVYNIQLICAPLKALRRVAKPLKLNFPAELSENKVLKQYAKDLSKIIQSTDMFDNDLLEIMREEKMMDARRDKEMKKAGAGGYYHSNKERIDEADFVDDMDDPRVELLEEGDLEDGDGLVRPFGGQSFGQVEVAIEDEEMEDAYSDDELDMEEDGDESEGEDSAPRCQLPASLQYQLSGHRESLFKEIGKGFDIPTVKMEREEGDPKEEEDPFGLSGANKW